MEFKLHLEYTDISLFYDSKGKFRVSLFIPITEKQTTLVFESAEQAIEYLKKISEAISYIKGLHDMEIVDL